MFHIHLALLLLLLGQDLVEGLLVDGLDDLAVRGSDDRNRELDPGPREGLARLDALVALPGLDVEVDVGGVVVEAIAPGTELGDLLLPLDDRLAGSLRALLALPPGRVALGLPASAVGAAVLLIPKVPEEVGVGAGALGTAPASSGAGDQVDVLRVEGRDPKVAQDVALDPLASVSLTRE